MAVTSSIRKIWDNLVGAQDEEYDEEENYGADYADDYEEVNEEVEPETRGVPFFRGRSDKKVVSMGQQQQITMKIAKPTNFDQADEIVNQLKAKNAVVINLEYVSKDVARRIIDVLCGAVKALDGNMEKVSNSIFVVAPFNYDIISEISKEKIESRFAQNWIK